MWITGASAGIGAALAGAVPFPATTVGISRSGVGPADEHVTADLAEPAGWEQVADDLRRRLDGFVGARAVFVHSAATIAPVGFAGVVDPAAYRRNVMLNAAAPPVLGDAFLRALASATLSQGALLLLLTSGAARTAYAGWSGYCAGKAATDHWVRTVALEQGAGSGVRVAAIAPGTVDTGMQAQVRASGPADFPSVERFRELHRSGGLADPADVARRIWALAETIDNGAVVDLRAI